MDDTGKMRLTFLEPLQGLVSREKANYAPPKEIEERPQPGCALTAFRKIKMAITFSKPTELKLFRKEAVKGIIQVPARVARSASCGCTPLLLSPLTSA
jgi:hypothetical protein